jgi:membrane-associated HD superfamily phosphohydrolase
MKLMIPLLKSNGMNLTGTPGDIGSAYFFHYSYIIFLFLLLVYSYSIKVKGEYMNKLFNFYIILTLIPSLIWYSSVAYGRIIYLSFPFMSFFLVILGDKFKEKWLEFLLVVVMLSVGIYFYSTSSMQATLTDNQFHEFYNISLFEPIKNTLT